MELILKYFPNLTKNQMNQFDQLYDLYVEWNSMINVISRKDMENFYERHVLHSLGIAKYTNFVKGSKILDVGTGGGFPGIPLAILFPDSDFYLVDSIGKKIKVVSSVAASIGLTNLRADHLRAEEVDGKYDFVVSRAVTALPDFVSWVRNKISKKQINSIPNGILYLKGGDINEEIAETKLQFSKFMLSSSYSEAFFETKMVVHLFE